MQTFHISIFFCAFALQLQAQAAFDPVMDTIATTNPCGLWKILVPEKSLIAAAQLVSPRLTHVHDVRVQDIHSKPYLFFRGKNSEMPELGFTVMVLLIETAKGVWKAGDIYQSCWGDACSECGFDEYWGCSCERYDGELDESAKSYCNHMVALGMGLGKVAIHK